MNFFSFSVPYDDTIDELIEELQECFSPKQKVRKPHGGSKPGKKPNRNRGFQQGHDRIMQDYLVPNPVYGVSFYQHDASVMHQNCDALFIKAGEYDVIEMSPAFY